MQIVHDGATREYTTTVDLDDIDQNGVPWSTLMRQPYAGKVGEVQRLATLLNIATVCGNNQRPRDELAALRMARRLTGGNFDLVNRRLAECSARRQNWASPPRGGLTVVTFDEDRERFEALLESNSIGNNFHHPGARFRGLTGVDRQLLIPLDASVDNVSFAICRGDARLAVVPCVIQGDDTISWIAPFLPSGGIPISIEFDEPVQEYGAILEVAMRHLDDLMMEFGARQVVIREPFPDRMLLYRTLGLVGTFSAEVWDRPVVQLADRREEEIFAGVRKSYKSHINWGRAHLALEYLSGSQLNDVAVQRVYQTIQQCHEKLIRTYGDGMSRDMFTAPIAMCRMGHGEVAIATTLSGAVCGITVVTDEGGISHYALGGSIPQDNKNPGQFIVYDSILRAKNRGSREFHLNREYAAPVSLDQLRTKVQSQHDTNLAFFKRGFNDRLDFIPVYKVLPRRAAFLGRPAPQAGRP